MKKLLLFFAIAISTLSFAQVPKATINSITKKLVMVDAKADGDVVNIRFDSLKVTSETMKEVLMSYLSGSLRKNKEINEKFDAFKRKTGGKITDENLEKSDYFINKISKIQDKQKVLMFDKLSKADTKKKIVLHSKAIYYLKLDDDITDGEYQSDYYYTLKGVLIPDIYEYLITNIN